MMGKGEVAAAAGVSPALVMPHFGSKDALQLAILTSGFERFGAMVVADAQRLPRGVDTVGALVDGWLSWSHDRLDGGCLFVTASVEFDDRPGPVREFLVAAYGKWYAMFADAARRAIGDGDFRADLDCEQFAHEVNGVMLAFNLADRLFHDPDAERRAQRALERLLEDAKP